MNKKTKPDSRGILLVATGEKYLNEAAESALQCKRVMPEVSICLATRTKPSSASVFDRILFLPEGADSYNDKILAMQELPFDRTLFLDTDTVCLEPVDELFDLLDHWDLAVAHAPVREFLHSPEGVPDYFTEFNTGVMAIRQTPQTKKLIQHWHQAHALICALYGPRTTDQPAFRQAMWQCRPRFFTLTPEYNLRTCMNYFVGGNARVKIVHDRSPRLKQALQLLKQDAKRPHPWVR